MNSPAVLKRGMPKPTPKPIAVDELVKLALGVIQVDRFPHLATIDGDQPRIRPVSPVRTDRFTVYVANLRSYHKTAEIQGNPKVELCHLDDHHDQVRDQRDLGGKEAGIVGGQAHEEGADEAAADRTEPADYDRSDDGEELGVA